MVPSLNARRHAEEALRSIARDDDSAGEGGLPNQVSSTVVSSGYRQSGRGLHTRIFTEGRVGHFFLP